LLCAEHNDADRRCGLQLRQRNRFGMKRHRAARIDEREARLLQMLEAGPRTLAELARERLLYPPHATDLWVDAAEARTIEQHLAELHASGRVLLDPETARWRLARR